MNDMADDQEPMLNKDEISKHRLQYFKLKDWKWWLLVVLHIIFLVAGQAAGIKLGRYHYEQGGKNKWMIALSQTAGFPLLFIPLFLLPSSQNPPTSSTSPSAIVLASFNFVRGVLVASETMLFSQGLSYLSASTYSLLCPTQLIFVAVFAYFINSQKFTALILNSMVVLSLFVALVAVNDNSEGPTEVSNLKYFIGFVCTLTASAIASLFLSLMQLSFQKVLRKETFSVVLEMQIYTQLVTTFASLVGLLASGDWTRLHEEMESSGKEGFAYVVTLFSTFLAWQVWCVSSTGLVFLVSSLFASAISNPSLAGAPIASVTVFHDNMNGVQIIVLLMAIWGFSPYTYQNYLDDSTARRRDVIEAVLGV